MNFTKSQEAQFFKEQARSDLLSFCIYTDKKFEVLPHHEIIADHLFKIMTGEIKNLIISMPPRAGKSRLMEEAISFLLGHFPETDIIYTGHTISILEDFSRHIRGRLNSAEYQSLFNTRIARDNSAVSSWKIEKGGVFSIFGVRGGITGKGGDLLVVDDPYKNREDAESETVRSTVSDWYWSTLQSRKQSDKTRQVVIMQRWREDDLVGEILEKEPGKWIELKIPALNENDESFWADRFSSEYFKQIRDRMPIFFSSQYQQDPVSEGSGVFRKEMFEYLAQGLTPPLNKLDIVTFIDPAISKKQEADSTGIVTVGMDRMTNLIYILEIKKLKAEPDEIIDEVFYTSDKYKNIGLSYRCGIEIVQYQKMLAIEIKKQMRIRSKFFVLQEVRPQGEKEARIKSTLQPRYSSGSIIHSKDVENLGELENELLKFPNGKHDDLIDATSQAISLLETNDIATNNYSMIDNSPMGDLDGLL